MANLFSQAVTYTNAGQAAATLGANANVVNRVNGLGSRTVMVKVAKTDITTAELNTIVKAIQAGGSQTGSDATKDDDAFTVAGVGTADGSAFVSGTTDVVFLACQGTGTITADSSNAYGVTGAATTVEAVFVDNA